MTSQEKGSWIIHHTNKLQNFTYSETFENILEAGKAGKLLASLSDTDNDALVDDKKVLALARNLKISKKELPQYLEDLEKRRLVEINPQGYVEVLAVATTSILDHTNKIFEDASPSSIESASLALSELVTNNPNTESSYTEELSDTYKLSKSETKDVIQLSKQLTFTDYEDLKDGETLLFNGNIFRKGAPDKLLAVLQSLNSKEERLVTEVEKFISETGCVPVAKVTTILGTPLFNKLHSIGFYDITTVANTRHELQFVSLPQAFSRYGNPFIEDGLGHAKQLVSALTYGVSFSPHSRGQIRDVSILLRKLIAGGTVGPANAIGQDYQVLELNGVVRIFPEKTSWGKLSFSMQLLKKDVGRIALQVLNQGDASGEVALAGASVNRYIDAESNRTEYRRLEQSQEHKKSTQDALLALRTK
jgi:hypothetical protein